MNWKQPVQSVLRRTGYVLTKLPLEGSLEREIQRVLSERTITTVLDVGAYVGGYGVMLRRIGFQGRIVSFEPSVRPFEQLASRLGPDWEALPIALGDKEGTTLLHEYQQHEELTSLRRPSDFGLSWGMDETRSVPVRVRRLDDVAEELQVDPTVTMVKIDTQGHEVAVMDGGLDFLRAAAALQIEIPMFGLYEDAPSPVDLLTRVHALGLDLVGMFPVHEPPRPLVPVEFDGLFVRS